MRDASGNLRQIRNFVEDRSDVGVVNRHGSLPLGNTSIVCDV
jgi:hypothetical protein